MSNGQILKSVGLKNMLTSLKYYIHSNAIYSDARFLLKEQIDSQRSIYVNDRGDIYFSDYQGMYCFGCERFYTEKELVDGKCPDHMTEPALINEANYFFKMSAYQDWLLEELKQKAGKEREIVCVRCDVTQHRDLENVVKKVLLCPEIKGVFHQQRLYPFEC